MAAERQGPPGPAPAKDMAWVPEGGFRPEGPGSTLHRRERHPVVQVAVDTSTGHISFRCVVRPITSTGP
jgi:sulfatase modifying factor 1